MNAGPFLFVICVGVMQFGAREKRLNGPTPLEILGASRAPKAPGSPPLPMGPKPKIKSGRSTTAQRAMGSIKMLRASGVPLGPGSSQPHGSAQIASRHLRGRRAGRDPDGRVGSGAGSRDDPHELPGMEGLRPLSPHGTPSPSK